MTSKFDDLLFELKEEHLKELQEMRLKLELAEVQIKDIMQIVAVEANNNYGPNVNSLLAKIVRKMQQVVERE